MQNMIQTRPPELELENCVIQTSYGTGGRVLEVCPHTPNPDWLPRPLLGGWAIVYLDRRGAKNWINEVFVEDGQIYAHPWRDRIEVVKKAPRQLRLF